MPYTCAENNFICDATQENVSRINAPSSLICLCSSIRVFTACALDRYILSYLVSHGSLAIHTALNEDFDDSANALADLRPHIHI